MTLTEWQAKIEALFPAAVNVRWMDNPDDPTAYTHDFEVVGIHVLSVGPGADDLPRVFFGATGTNKSYDLRLTSFEQTQTEPFVNIRVTFNKDPQYTMVWWPCPVDDVVANDSAKQDQRDNVLAMVG